MRSIAGRAPNFKGLDMLAHEEHSSNPFDAARAGSCEDILTFLFDDTKIDEPNNKGNTMLMLAAWYGHAKAVEFLLLKGASPLHRNEDGACVLQFGSRNHDVLSLLLATEAVKDIDTQDYEGYTPLIQAANIYSSETLLPGHDLSVIGERIKCIETLLKHGADVNIVTGQGRSALMVAASTNSVPFVQALLKGNANPSLVCRKGQRAIDLTTNAAVKIALDPEYGVLKI
jgi:ankyrin repeat protein